MKKTLIICCFLFASNLANAQENNNTTKQIGIAPFAVEKINVSESGSTRSISPFTSMMLKDKQRLLQTGNDKTLTHEEFKNKYHLKEINGILYANSFIKTTDNYNIESLSEFGVIPSSKMKNIFTALIPIDQILTISKRKNIKYIEIGEPAKLLMDNARTVTNVNQVHQGVNLPQSYKGEGVVVGIIDVGFDYTHPNFFDSTGTNNYRIKRVWEQASTGTPPAGFSYGRELTTQNAIINAETDFYDQSHGSHVAGIAAGAGGGTTNEYTGAAPKSDIVLVAPLASGNNVDFIDGINYIKNYAASVNKPCVINLSWGSHTGPHDGTSLFDESCDNIVDDGLILVGANGNEGNDYLYLQKTFTANDTNLYTFIVFPNSLNGSDGFTFLDIWGEPNKNFWVTAHIFNTATNTFEDYLPFFYAANYDSFYSETMYDNDWIYPDPCYIDITTGINPNNNKPRALLTIDHTSQDDYNKFVLIQIIGNTTTTRMWSSSSELSDLSYYGVNSGSTNSTMGEIGGTGKNMISVGAYTSKNNWIAYNSSYQNNGAFNGQIANFSSKGPTADNRTKPDVAAPGNVIVSSVNSFDNYNYYLYDNKVVSGINNGTNYWWFGTMQGTSMSAPMVTGIIALWLQAYPYLTPEQAKDIIKATTITDANTGSIPAAGNNTWGWGKINAWAGIQEIHNKIPDTPTITPNSGELCNGPVTLSAPAGYVAYLWSNNSTSQSISVNTPGNYNVQVTNNLGFKSAWSYNVTVSDNRPPKPTINVNGNTLTSSAASGNQWYRNSNPIPNATAKTYTATQNGIYKVKVTNNNNCFNESNEINHTFTHIEELTTQNKIKIFPNPAKENINIKFNHSDREIVLHVYDQKGSVVIQQNVGTVNKNATLTVNIGALSNGIYKLSIIGNETHHAESFTVVAH